MADLLAQHLKKQSEAHSALQLLFSQWDFDSKLIPKALQTVGNLFPHYSRHDESHSRQILVNIERLLGNNLTLLTATDTWLLLEAAYWHDIGMVVPQRDLEEALSDPEFNAFLRTFVSQPHHELHAIAAAVEAKTGSFQIFFSEAPLNAVTRFRELMAEWFRRKHPARAEHIVKTPDHSVGLSSPRTELIPARLFNILGRICSMHGASFETLVGADGLSFREAGMGRDDCHPRFVACLLRLGDLLDLDDNRFCPVMQSIAGKDRPALSKAHEDKHAAIRHLRIDQERISIEAECKTVDGYLETFRWFGWLKEEINAQMSQWRDIVPTRELGLLPMLGPISVRLAGNLKVLKNGERPAFSLDTEKAIELLQGNNLYESEYACIRELLQNSADATLLKIWMTNRSQLGDSCWASPNEVKIRELLTNAKIKVSLVESEGRITDAGKMSSWTLTIQDSGTGISINDLQHMLQIGGSYRNKTRRREIDRMPEWMKPSGVFGIGFQSIFMLCNQVTLKTKSLTTNDILEITMYSPTGPHEGLVVIKQLEPDVSEPTGTTITVEFEKERFSKRWIVSIEHDDSISSRVAKSFDPVLDDSFPFTVAKLADHVREFGENSIIRVEGTLQTQSCSYPLSEEKNAPPADGEPNPWRFFRTSNAEVRLRYYPKSELHSFTELETFYRGQKFKANSLSLPSVIVELDLMSGSAGNWLNFSRDKISAAGEKKLNSTILESLEAAVVQDIQAWENGEHPWAFQEKMRPATSFFLKSMALMYGGSWIDHSKCLGDAWLDVPWNKNGASLRPFFQREDWILATYRLGDEISERDHDFAIYNNSPLDRAALVASEWLKIPEKSLKIIGDNEIFNKSTEIKSSNPKYINNNFLDLRFRFASERLEPYDDAAFAAALAKIIRRPFGNERYRSPLRERFARLSLASGTKLYARNLFPIISGNNTDVVLPFLFRGTAQENGISIEATSEQIERLCIWVQPRLHRPSDLGTIRGLYNELIHWIDNEIMAATIFSEKWFLARGLIRSGNEK